MVDGNLCVIIMFTLIYYDSWFDLMKERDHDFVLDLDIGGDNSHLWGRLSDSCVSG